MTVRAGTTADIDDALTVSRVADAHRRGHAPDAGLGDRDDRSGQRLASRDAFFLVAHHAAGSMVGVAAGLVGREDRGAGPIIPGLCHISMVAVLPEHWGRGVGKQLLRSLLELGHDRGYERFQLFTHADNIRARRLYEGLGFALTGKTDTSRSGEFIVHYLLGHRLG